MTKVFLMKLLLFPEAAALQEQKTVALKIFVPHNNINIVENGAGKCTHFCLTVLNLLCSLWNGCKTSLQTRNGCLKCLASNLLNNWNQPNEDRSVWSVSSPRIRPGSLPFSMWLVQTPRFCSMEGVTVLLSYKLVLLLPQKGKQSAHHPGSCREVTRRSISPITNNTSPSCTQAGKTKSKNIKEIHRCQTKEEV